jgi:hypothetical protein
MSDLPEFPLVIAIISWSVGAISGALFMDSFKVWREKREYNRGRRDGLAMAAKHFGITEQQLQANRALEMWHKERRLRLINGQYMRGAK